MYTNKQREIIDSGIQKWTSLFDAQVIAWDSVRLHIVVFVPDVVVAVVIYQNYVSSVNFHILYNM